MIKASTPRGAVLFVIARSLALAILTTRARSASFTRMTTPTTSGRANGYPHIASGPMASAHVSALERFGLQCGRCTRWQNAGSPGRYTNTRHIIMPGVLVVPFVLGRDFDVAEIQVLLRQSLTRALCATGGGLASPAPFVGAAKVLLRQTLTRFARFSFVSRSAWRRKKTVVTTSGQTREFNPQH